MGEAIKRSGVSGFAWGAMITIFITLMSYTVSIAAGKQKMKDDIEVNASDIERHDVETSKALDNKASKEKVDMTYDIVLRIEEKLDEHMQHD